MTEFSLFRVNCPFKWNLGSRQLKLSWDCKIVKCWHVAKDIHLCPWFGEFPRYKGVLFCYFQLTFSACFLSVSFLRFPLYVQGWKSWHAQKSCQSLWVEVDLLLCNWAYTVCICVSVYERDCLLWWLFFFSTGKRMR